jgi:hypothetical protein
MEYTGSEEGASAWSNSHEEGENEGYNSTQAAILEQFQQSLGSKLTVDSMQPSEVFIDSDEEAPPQPVPVKRGRGRPRKSAPKTSNTSTTTTTTTALKKESLINEMQEKGKDLVLDTKEKWEREKKETVEKLSNKAVRDLDTKIRKAQKMADESARESVEFGYNAELSEKEHAAKMSLLKKIQMFYNFYPNLKESNDRRGKWSLKTSIKDLQDEIARCNSQLSLERSFHTICQIDTLLNYGVEQILIQGFSVPCHGLAAEAQRSREAVEDELKELSIKYHEYLETGPELRYLMKFVQRVSFVLQRNHDLLRTGSGVTNSYDKQEEDYTVIHNKYDSL